MAQRKMVDLAIEETSGVDHPAHLHEGWLVMKSAAPAEVWSVLDGVGPDNPGDSMSQEMEKSLETALARLAELEAENAVLKAAPSTPADETPEDAVAKALQALPEPARAAIEQMQKAAETALAQANEAQETLRKEREQRADDEVTAMVKSWDGLSIDADKVGPALRKFRDADPETYAEVEKALKGAAAIADSAAIFKAIGKTGHGVETDAYSQIQAKADSLQAADPTLSKAEAFAKAVDQDPALYAAYQAEKKG